MDLAACPIHQKSALDTMTPYIIVRLIITDSVINFIDMQDAPESALYLDR